MNRQRKAIIVGTILTTMIVAFLSYNRWKEQNSLKLINNIRKERIDKFHQVKKMEVTEKMHEQANVILKSLPEKDPADSKFKKELTRRLLNESMGAFFDYTLDYFGSTPGGFNAAVFVAMTMSFEDSLAMREIMMTNDRKLKENSGAIMSFLETRSSELNSNSYFHSRMLNLVHRLDVDPNRKMGIYGNTISSPIQMASETDLNEDSLAIEIALLLARQTKAKSEVLLPYLTSAISINQRSPAALQALKLRISKVFPEYQPLFESLHQ